MLLILIIYIMVCIIIYMYMCFSSIVTIMHDTTGRMGNQKRALQLIINELQDVDKVNCYITDIYYV